MPPFHNLSERRFGRLTVIRRLSHQQWECQCDCGKIVAVKSGNLLNKRSGTKSCGCLNAELRVVRAQTQFRTHGMRATPEYQAYYSAKSRCTKPRSRGYKHYGGRGIEFRFTSFEEFFGELVPRPVGMTLDRKNNNGHYEVGNVRWATWKQQNNNRRVAVKRIEPRTKRQTRTTRT